jgi:hypothetical protein
MKSRQSHAPAVAAAKAGFSIATAYRMEADPRLPSQKTKPRGRRRSDPLAGVWEWEIVPMLEAAPGVRAVAIFEEICRRHPDLAIGVRRTLERRVARWRALTWPQPGCDVPPGTPAGSDGPVGLHRPGLAWRHDCGRAALASALSPSARLLGLCACPCGARRRELRGTRRRPAERAVGAGGVPEQHRSDSLSAAFRNLDREVQNELTRRYEELCGHYGMTPTRNNPGIAHENGAIESAHGHLKKVLGDELLLRRSRDFADLAAYRRFVDEVVGRRNAPKEPDGPPLAPDGLMDPRGSADGMAVSASEPHTCTPVVAGAIWPVIGIGHDAPPPEPHPKTDPLAMRATAIARVISILFFYVDNVIEIQFCTCSKRR